MANELFDAVKKFLQNSNLATGEFPSDAFLKDALKSLQDLEFLPSDLKNPSVGDVIEAVRKFQKFLNPAANPEGILTRGVVRALIGAIGCADSKKLRDDSAKVQPVKGDGADSSLYTIRYFVEYSTFSPAYDGVTTQRLIANAWEEWIAVTKFLFVDEVIEKDVANVIVSRGEVAGAAVGLADVAGPGNFKNITVTIEADSGWSKEEFQGVACHEFGHVLGLDHCTSQLMSAVIPRGTYLPGAADIAAIQRIYQKPTTRRARVSDFPIFG